MIDNFYTIYSYFKYIIIFIIINRWDAEGIPTKIKIYIILLINLVVIIFRIIGNFLFINILEYLLI